MSNLNDYLDHRISVDGGTNIGDGLRRAYYMLQSLMIQIKNMWYC